MAPGDARAALRQADGYFASLGVNLATVTRIPGNRREHRSLLSGETVGGYAAKGMS